LSAFIAALLLISVAPLAQADPPPEVAEVVEGTVVMVVGEDPWSGPNIDVAHQPVDESRTIIFLVSDEGWVEVADEVLESANLGDTVVVELAADGEVLDVEVLEEADLNIAGGGAVGGVNSAHIVDVVIMTPPGVAVADYAKREVLAQLALVDTYWQAQSGGLISFAIGQLVAAPGVLPGCNELWETWGIATQLVKADWQTYLTPTREAAGRHLFVVIPEDTCAAEIGWLGMATVGDGITSGGYALSTQGADHSFKRVIGGRTVTGVDTVTADVLAHELGHNLGFLHAGIAYCASGNPDVRMNVALPDSSPCRLTQYHDFIDLMGFSGRTNQRCPDCFGAIGVVQAARAGFSIGEVAIPVGTINKTITLNAISTAGGTRAATVVDPATGEKYFFELREAYGYDGWFTPTRFYGWDNLQHTGVRVVKEVSGQSPSSLNDANGASMVVLLNRGIAFGGNSYGRSTSLLAGETFTSATGNVIVTVNSYSGTSASINVTVADARSRPRNMPPSIPDPTPAPTPSPSPAPAVQFVDVTASNEFYADIHWLAGQSITTGWPDGTFRPLAQVERQAMAAFLYRMAGRPQHTPPAVSPFIDVWPGDAFYSEITWLFGQGISTGTRTSEGSYRFDPTAAVTREAMAAFLYRAAGSPSHTPATRPRFLDVSTGHPFYKEIDWLAATGITTGWTLANGRVEFRPGNPIERQAIAAFLYRYAHLSGS